MMCRSWLANPHLSGGLDDDDSAAVENIVVNP